MDISWRSYAPKAWSLPAMQVRIHGEWRATPPVTTSQLAYELYDRIVVKEVTHFGETTDNLMRIFWALAPGVYANEADDAWFRDTAIQAFFHPAKRHYPWH